MKTIYRLIIFSVCFAISACGPSAEQLTATSVVVQAQTLTAAPTLSPTLSPTKTSTPKPTKTLTSPEGKINLGTPENQKAFLNTGFLSFNADETQLNGVVKDMLSNLEKFSMCPEIWVESIPNEPTPLFGVYVSASIEDRDKAFAIILRPTIPGVEPYGTLSVGEILPEAQGKVLGYTGYKSTDGNLNPDQFEIQAAFPGCKLYKEIVVLPFLTE